jgi:predicted ArsR family transcriptional regulator
VARGKAVTDCDRVRLLHTLAQLPEGATQRAVAERLGVTKVEARQQLRAAVSDGLVVEVVERSLAEPGRRVFSLRHPEGVEALERLQAQQLSPEGSGERDWPKAWRNR